MPTYEKMVVDILVSMLNDEDYSLADLLSFLADHDYPQDEVSILLIKKELTRLDCVNIQHNSLSLKQSSYLEVLETVMIVSNYLSKHRR